MLSFNRWYEKNPVCREAFNHWECFPRGLQRALALHLQTMLDKKEIQIKPTGKFFFIHNFILTHVSPIPSRRWYDNDPMIRDVINQLAFVPYEDMYELAPKIVKIKTYLDLQNLDVSRYSELQLKTLVIEIFNRKGTYL